MIENHSAWTEISWGTTADVLFPGTGDGRPVKRFSAIVGRKQADPSRSTPQYIQDRLANVQHDLREICKYLHQCHKRLAFLFIIRWP